MVTDSGWLIYAKAGLLEALESLILGGLEIYCYNNGLGIGTTVHYNASMGREDIPLISTVCFSCPTCPVFALTAYGVAGGGSTKKAGSRDHPLMECKEWCVQMAYSI